MKYVCSFLFAALCFAEQPAKPVCGASNQSQFWPEEANVDRDAARLFAQRGELEMCVLKDRKFNWERVGVNVRDLAKGRRSASSESRKDINR